MTEDTGWNEVKHADPTPVIPAEAGIHVAASSCRSGSSVFDDAVHGVSRALARSLNANFCTFPVEVFGREPNTTVLGTL